MTSGISVLTQILKWSVLAMFNIDPTKRYTSNPYINGSILAPVGKKQVTISPFKRAADSTISLVNTGSGEIMGTAVVTYKRVDTEQFIKLFAQNIGMAFELSSAGIKALTVLIWAVQKSAINIDVITLDVYTLEDFLKANADRKLKLSDITFKRGLTELCKANIIAKARRLADYYINPYFMFNGDRLAFATVLEKGEPVPEPEDFRLEGQIDENTADTDTRYNPI